MTVAETAWEVYLAVSFSSCALLLLLLPPFLLPTSVTSISFVQCPRPPAVSLIIATAIRAGLSGLDWATENGSGGQIMLCEVDTILTTFFTTAVVAHLPIVALTCHAALATPARPTPNPFSTRLSSLLIIGIYGYALVPVIAILATWGANLPPNGFGLWWGYYCREQADWWRVVRPLLLAPLLFFTILLTILSMATLYSTTDHPSLEIRSTPRLWLQTLILFTSSCCTIAYLICEQVMGWDADWWPRVFESASGPIVFITLACNPRLYICYAHWALFRRPPPVQESTLPFEVASIKPKSNKKNRSSSFSTWIRHPSFMVTHPPLPNSIWSIEKNRAGLLPTLRSPVAPILETDRYDDLKMVIFPMASPHELDVGLKDPQFISNQDDNTEIPLGHYLYPQGNSRNALPQPSFQQFNDRQQIYDYSSLINTAERPRSFSSVPSMYSANDSLAALSDCEESLVAPRHRLIEYAQQKARSPYNSIFDGSITFTEPVVTEPTRPRTPRKQSVECMANSTNSYYGSSVGSPRSIGDGVWGAQNKRSPRLNMI